MRRVRGSPEPNLRGEYDELALLVPVGQNLQAVSHDGEELVVVALEKGDHLLEPAGQPHGHL